MKAKFKKVVTAVVAAVTSPEAVTAEKNVAVLVVTRVLLAVGAGTAFVEIAAKVIQGL